MKRLKLFFACLLMAVLSIGQVWATPVAATLTAGTNGAAATVNSKDAIKVGTSKKSGDMTITVGAGATTLNLHAVAWSGAAGTIDLSAPTGVTLSQTSLSLSANSNVSGTSTDYTIETEADYLFTITLTGVSAETEITLTGGTASGKAKRFVVWEATYETSGGGSTPTPSLSVSPAVIDFGTVDQNAVVENKTVTVNFENLTGSVTYNGLSGAFSASGSISATGDKITISANTATVGDYSQTLTVQSAADSKSQDVTVKMNVVEPFDGSVLEIVKGDFTNTSYDDNAGDHEKSGITFTTAKVYQSGGGIQFQKTNGLLYNKTDLGEIAKIEITTVSGKANNLVVYSGTTENPTSGAVTGSTSGSVTTYTFAAGKGFFAIKCNSTGASNVDPIKVYYTSSASSVAKPTISGDENFVGSTTVAITHADADAIYYTTDGSDPKTSGTKQTYSVPFTVNADGTTTVKAYAVKGSDASAVAEKTFTKVTPMTTAAELRSFATSSAQDAFIQLDGWKVTFVNGNNAYMIDPSNEGVILNNAGHGYVAGDELNDEVVEASVKLASGRVQLSGFTSTDITATSGTVSPVDVTDFSTVLAANQSRLITLKNATYASSTGTFSDGEHLIYFYDQFSANPTLVDGTTYDVTGIVIYYKNNTDDKIEIAPRTAADVKAQTPVVIPTAANLAALKSAARGTYILTLTNAVVTYVNGNNAFIEDATGGALIYFASHGYSAGDCLNGDYQVTTIDYQGKFEITAMEPQTGAATTTAAIPLTTVTITALNANFGSYESRRVKIVGANVTDAIKNTDRNGAINDGAALAVYAAVASTITLNADDNVDIIGYPGFHNTDQQLNVWRQEDITVNVKEDPELAYTPTVVNVLLSDLASFTPADLEYATGFDGVAAITYESSDPSIATVETDGTVTIVATEEGSTTITATFAGNATYKADNASYTINVSAAPIVPVYTMSFDMTRASYDAAADAQVVWNSSVVTMTADKNTSSTKANNYIGGGYNGDTHCADSRFYPGSIITFAPADGVTITKVEWTATSNSYANNLVGASWTNATATAEGSIVTITPSASGDFSAEIAASKQTRATAVTVYYEAESEKSKLAASISIDDINTAVGEDDIVLLNIAATSNPNKNAISYAITSGTAVSLVGEGKAAAFHALAEGTATITATIPDNLGNYTGATTTFDIVVAAAPATLVSIAISGEATALEYTEGQDFVPTGLVVTGTYSDASTAPITEGITWAFDPSPLTVGTTSVSVTATVSEINSAAFEVNGLNVSAAPVPTSGNIVILAEYNSKFYAMTNSLSSGALAGVEVEKDGSKIVVSSAEDKAAIQWTATVDGDNTTLKDGDDYYIKGSSGASLLLETDPYNWNWDGEKSCYISSAYTNRGLFFSNSGNVFKGYALSNITSDGYAATEVIEIDPEDIVISSKVDPALAYTPASDEITVGDAWSAPELTYASGFDGLAAVTYASNNEAVATVSDAGVIALAGGTGTATITATFGGNASYLAGSATYTVKVNEPAEDCDGTDDFLDTEDKGSPTSYTNRSTPNGWSATNAGYKVIDEKAYWMINGKTTAYGVITSPELTGGLGSLKFRYANTNSESNGVSVKIEIKQGGDVVKEYTLTKPNSEVVQNTVYTELIENINVAGTFQIVITNLSPSNNTGNKDRVSIGRFCWSSYSAPEPPTPVYETVREDLIAGNYYTICYPKAMTDVQGATLWSFVGKDANFAYIEQETATTIEAGKPYIMYATASTVTAVLGTDVASAGVNGAIHGTLDPMVQGDLDDAATDAGSDVYLVIGNELRRATGTGTGSNTLPAQRAFVVLGDIPAAPAHMPAHVRAMPMHKDAATGMDNVQGDDVQCTKVLIDGQMYILRGNRMYDVTGKLVK